MPSGSDIDGKGIPEFAITEDAIKLGKIVLETGKSFSSRGKKLDVNHRAWQFGQWLVVQVTTVLVN